MQIGCKHIDLSDLPSCADDGPGGPKHVGAIMR